jgi:hypothetical protein
VKQALLPGQNGTDILKRTVQNFPTWVRSAVEMNGGHKDHVHTQRQDESCSVMYHHTTRHLDT